ncbi:MAG: 50S ribosomal protein L18 [Candidatus Margulisiibacteriota bacterium]
MKRKSNKKTAIKSSELRHRLSVFRSNKFIYAQIIDDAKGVTLVSASSLKSTPSHNVAAAQAVGKILAESALKLNIKDVVFDRGSYVYKGRVSALADAAREHGLNF